MNAIIKKNSVDISSAVDWTTLDVSSVLTKEVSLVKFDVVIPLGNATTSLPMLSDTIDVYDQSGNHIFGGLVTQSISKTEGLLITYSITATDWGFKLDSRLVAKTYTNMDPYDILADILTNYASAGFTMTHAQRGNFLIATIKFNYMPVTKAIEKLAKQIGWDWFVDPNKDIWFFLGSVQGGVGTGAIAPFNIELATGNIITNSLSIDYSIQNLKNSVYVIGSSKKTTYTAITTPDVYTTVAGTLIYHLGYAYGQTTIFVTLNGVLQTVGKLNQDDPAGYQVLYSQTDKLIQFSADPGSGKTVVVYGTAEVPIVAHVKNDASIATYGEIQDVITDKQITSTNQAMERAQAELLQFGHPVYDIKFTTRTTGLAIGQTMKINLTSFGITNYPVVIKRIEAIGYTPNNLIFHVEAIGSDTVTFVDIMTTLLLQEQYGTDTDNTVLQEILTINETLTMSDTVTLSSGNRPWPWGVASPQMHWGFFTWN